MDMKQAIDPNKCKTSVSGSHSTSKSGHKDSFLPEERIRVDVKNEDLIPYLFRHKDSKMDSC